MNIVLDFETYYHKKDGPSITIDGLDNYVDKSYAYLVSVAAEDGTRWCGNPAGLMQHPELVERLWNADNHVWAANSNFDEAWFNKLYPKLPNPWQCVLDAGRVNQVSGNLAGITEICNGRIITKDIRDAMNKRHWDDCAPEEKAAMIDYGMQDSVETLEAIQKLPMSDFEARLAAHTRAMNRKGLQIDVDLLDRFMETAEYAKIENLKRLPWRHDYPPLSPEALPAWCLAMGLVCPKSRDQRDEEFTLFCTANPPVALVVQYMRQYDAANKFLEKLRAIQRRLRHDGSVPLEFIFCGAPHTRRWSCRGINFQNLDRAPLFYDSNWNECNKPAGIGADFALNADLRYVWLRHLIIAPPGKIMAALDFAQIEPRCLAWHVGDDEMLGLCRSGRRYYDAYAEKYSGWVGDDLKKSDPALYQKTKVDGLGCGYGIGAEKLQGTARNYGIFLTDAEALGVVTKFRFANPRIVNFWDMFTKLARDTMLRRGDRKLTINMPNGELMHHFDLRPHVTEKGKATIRSKTMLKPKGKEGFCWGVWGGLLTENVTQRMARDVLGEAILNLEDAGASIYFHAHDEAVFLLDKESELEDAKQVMRRSPAWAPELPLDVDGEILPRYTKM